LAMVVALVVGRSPIAPRSLFHGRLRHARGSLLVVLINLTLTAADCLARPSPQEEVPHGLLDHVKAIKHLIDLFCADVLLRFPEDRAAV